MFVGIASLLRRRRQLSPRVYCILMHAAVYKYLACAWQVTSLHLMTVKGRGTPPVTANGHCPQMELMLGLQCECGLILAARCYSPNAKLRSGRNHSGNFDQ